MKHDVIIAGHSFAGLAVASQLRGRVLLIDPIQFVLGLVESFLMGFYVALIFVPVYNLLKAKA